MLEFSWKYIGVLSFILRTCCITYFWIWNANSPVDVAVFQGRINNYADSQVMPYKIISRLFELSEFITYDLDNNYYTQLIDYSQRQLEHEINVCLWF